ncbi:Guanine nucleotide binding protein (G protein), beta polypeptide 1-like [Aspergillus hancockii]|nr:Guanine nucleotide binding protein (G protein), beta polypeptide 1-like [Aspergillus hancockii]
MSASTQPRPPATPTYILRGHASPIHGLHIFHKNLRIISGDAEGWIIIWDLVFKRPVAVWKAHEGAVLEVKALSLDAGKVTEVYTHGRDHKLCVWRFHARDEDLLEKTLPVDRVEESRSQPQPQSQSQSSTPLQPWLVHSLPVNALNFCAFSMLSINGHVETSTKEDTPPRSSVLFAVPNALDSGAIDLFHLPRERRVCTIPAGTTRETGMVMAVKLFFSPSGELYVASAYEDGHVMVFARRARLTPRDFEGTYGDGWKWEKIYVSRPHSQPVLSLDVGSGAGWFVSSGADALLVRHPVPGLGSISIQEAPVKSVDTKHAGQQGLRIRGDGRIFATAGWDCRVRVYSCKSMRELAVLKWHKEGCYAVAFADVSVSASNGADETGQSPNNGGDGDRAQVVRRGEGEFSLATVQQQRNQKVQETHWLAAGSKDGRISLWDIY